MPVQCLTPNQKQLIVAWYKDKILCQKELAAKFGTSERTIHRVLVEHGLATPVARIKGEAWQVMQLLKAHGIDCPTLQRILEARAAVLNTRNRPTRPIATVQQQALFAGATA